MYCKECGSRLEPTDTVCRECGARAPESDFQWKIKDFPEPRLLKNVEVDWQGGILRDLSTGRVYSQSDNEWHVVEESPAQEKGADMKDDSQSEDSSKKRAGSLLEKMLAETEEKEHEAEDNGKGLDSLDLYNEDDDLSDLYDIDPEDSRGLPVSDPAEKASGRAYMYGEDQVDIRSFDSDADDDDLNYRMVTMYRTSDGRVAMEVMSKEEERAIAEAKEADRLARLDEIQRARDEQQKSGEDRSRKLMEEKLSIQDARRNFGIAAAEKENDAKKRFASLIDKEKEYKEELERLGQTDFISEADDQAVNETDPAGDIEKIKRDAEEFDSVLAEFEERSKEKEKEIFSQPTGGFTIDDLREELGLSGSKSDDVMFKTTDIHSFFKDISDTSEEAAASEEDDDDGLDKTQRYIFGTESYADKMKREDEESEVEGSIVSEDEKNKEVRIKIQEPTGTKVTIKTQEVKLVPSSDSERIKTREVAVDDLEGLREGPKNVRLSVEVEAKKGQASVEVVRLHDGRMRVRTVEDGEEGSEKMFGDELDAVSENDIDNAYGSGETFIDEPIQTMERLKKRTAHDMSGVSDETAEYRLGEGDISENASMEVEDAISSLSYAGSAQGASRSPGKLPDAEELFWKQVLEKAGSEEEVPESDWDEIDKAINAALDAAIAELELDPDIIYGPDDEEDQDMSEEGLEPAVSSISDFTPTGPLGIIETAADNMFDLSEDDEDRNDDDDDMPGTGISPDDTDHAINTLFFKNQDDPEDESEEKKSRSRKTESTAAIRICKIIIAALIIILVAEFGAIGVKLAKPGETYDTPDPSVQADLTAEQQPGDVQGEQL